MHLHHAFGTNACRELIQKQQATICFHIASAGSGSFAAIHSFKLTIIPFPLVPWQNLRAREVQQRIWVQVESPGERFHRVPGASGILTFPIPKLLTMMLV
jgi:hypothetical protein